MSEESDLIQPERRHQKALVRRLKVLRDRMHTSSSNSFDKAEAEALSTAIALFDLHFAAQHVEDVVETSALLRDAADALRSHGLHSQAKRLDGRADLLEQQ